MPRPFVMICRSFNLLRVCVNVPRYRWGETFGSFINLLDFFWKLSLSIIQICDKSTLKTIYGLLTIPSNTINVVKNVNYSSLSIRQKLFNSWRIQKEIRKRRGSPVQKDQKKRKRTAFDIQSSLIQRQQRPLMLGTRPQTAAKKEIILNSK